MAGLVEFAEDEQLSWVVVRQWLLNLKEVAYDANDLLSELAYETTQFRSQHKEVQIFSSISRTIDNMVRKAKFRLRMARRLKKLKQSLEKIQRDSQYLQLTSVQCSGEEIVFHNFWLTDSQKEAQ